MEGDSLKINNGSRHYLAANMRLVAKNTTVYKVNMLKEQIFICGADELELLQDETFTHAIRITNPGASLSRLSWFHGQELSFYFGDVHSVADAKKWNTQPPTIGDIKLALDFTSAAFHLINHKILFHCDYGASRSPAMAYVCLANFLGKGAEKEAFDTVMAARPDAMPNAYIVSLGDSLLHRQGQLTRALMENTDPELDLFFGELFGGHHMRAKKES